MSQLQAQPDRTNWEAKSGSCFEEGCSEGWRGGGATVGLVTSQSIYGIGGSPGALCKRTPVHRPSTRATLQHRITATTVNGIEGPAPEALNDSMLQCTPGPGGRGRR